MLSCLCPQPAIVLTQAVQGAKMCCLSVSSLESVEQQAELFLVFRNTGTTIFGSCVTDTYQCHRASGRLIDWLLPLNHDQMFGVMERHC